MTCFGCKKSDGDLGIGICPSCREALEVGRAVMEMGQFCSLERGLYHDEYPKCEFSGPGCSLCSYWDVGYRIESHAEAAERIGREELEGEGQ